MAAAKMEAETALQKAMKSKTDFGLPIRVAQSLQHNSNTMKSTLKILLLFWVYQVSAQIPEGYYYKDLNKNLSSLDSLIRITHPTLKDTYYVLTYPLHDAVSSAGMQLHKAYHTARNSNKEIVLIIQNEGSFRAKDIRPFLKKILKISDKEAENIRLVTDKTTYEYVMQGKELIRLLYVFRKQVFYNENQKLHSVIAENLPNEEFEIVMQDSVKLSGIENSFIKRNDVMFSYKKDHLLMLGDITNVLFDINTLTGEVSPFFDIREYFEPCELFYKKIANYDTAKYNFAKKYNERYIERNRQTLQLTNVKYQNDKLVGTFSIEIMIKNDKESSFLSDEGKKEVRKVGKKVLQHYMFFFVWNPATKEMEKVAHILNQPFENTYTNIDCGFYYKSDTLYTAVTRYPAPKTPKHRIAMYSTQGEDVAFIKFVGPLTNDDELFAYYGTADYFNDFAGKLLYNYCCLGEVCEVGQEASISTLYGDGTEPYESISYKRFADVSNITQLNFRLFAVNPIFDGQQLLTFYQYKNNYVFEFKDKKLQTIDVIEAKNIESFTNYLGYKQGKKMIIQNNQIYFIDLINDEYYIKSFLINYNFENKI